MNKNQKKIYEHNKKIDRQLKGDCSSRDKLTKEPKQKETKSTKEQKKGK